MAATSSEKVEAMPSTQQIENLMRTCASLSEALDRSRRVRRLLVLVTVALVAVICFMFYRLGSELASAEYRAQLQATAQERLSKNSEGYMRELQVLVDHSRPVVTDAFYKQAKKDLPSYVRAAKAERDKLADELKERLAARLNAHYEHALAQHQKKLEDKFPNIKDPELHKKMTGNLHTAIEKLVQKYFVADMQTQLTALYDGWDQFPQAEAPGRGQPPLEDQFIGNLLELLKVELTDSKSPAAQ
jgi:hypothetical protein